MTIKNWIKTCDWVSHCWSSDYSVLISALPLSVSPSVSMHIYKYIYIYIYIMIFKRYYLSNPSTKDIMRLKDNNYLSRIKLVWIQSFLFSKLVTLLRQKNPNCLTIYTKPGAKGINANWSTNNHRLGFEPGLPILFPKMIAINQNKNI